ncbi:MAG: glycosyltransferase [Betaproteobacteria bacterium]|nr:glycosyltransferase [Betaproteobacteria bacterium]
MKGVCYQVNLQSNFGGGEVYTRFFTEALSELGLRSVLLVARGTGYWRDLLPSAEIHEVADDAALLATLPETASLVVTHTTLAPELAARVAARHRLAGFVHMPLYEREPRGLAHYHRVWAVSRHVMASALARGLHNVHSEPLYAVADIAPRRPAKGPLRAASVYSWDRRKARDRLAGWLEPFVEPFVPRPAYRRRPGITLGIVSRLTPIKQFPLLFQASTAVLAPLTDINIDIFGSGGYASVRDLRRAVAPLGTRVRFWGDQADVAQVYRQLDYVMSGLPEKEALGLNLIEAQYCGTPVLAVDAPPFDETVAHGETGYLFTDPRHDGGADFGRLLEAIRRGLARPAPLQATSHLARFSRSAFRDRVSCAIIETMR